MTQLQTPIGGHVNVLAGALLAGSGVVLGAFGAHALRDRLDPAALQAWETAVLYQLVHAVALLALAPVVAGAARPRGPVVASALLEAGVVLFSGSIYALALGGPPLLGPVTPLGGTLMIAGWAVLAAWAVRAWRRSGAGSQGSQSWSR